MTAPKNPLESPEKRTLTLPANVVVAERMASAYSGLPTDTRNANNTRRILAYILAYQFWQGKLPESLQPILGRLLMYMQNGQFDTDVKKGIKAIYDLNAYGNLSRYKAGDSLVWTDNYYYWALLALAKARGLNVDVSSADPKTTQSQFVNFANKVMPPSNWTGYDKNYTLDSLNHQVKIAIGYIPAGTPAPTAAQVQAQAQSVPASVAVPPPPPTNNVIADTFNQAAHGLQTTLYEATGGKAKLSTGQSGLVLAAVGVLIGVAIFFVGVYLEKKGK